MSGSISCPAGHQSTAADYCSECGTQIASAAAPAAGCNTAGPAELVCPKCSEKRDKLSSPYCGVCGYDFVNKQGGEVVVVPPPAKNTPPPATSAGLVELEVAVAGGAPQSYRFADAEIIIGRKSRSVTQTLGVENDDGISRQHIKIVRESDGRYSVSDLGSTNGTKHNTVDLAKGQVATLSSGDVLAIGVHTTITVKNLR